MNPWYEHLVGECMAEHDRVCIDGAECKQRKVHTESAYIAPALRHRVEELQGQVAHAEAIIRRQERYIEGLESADAVGLKARTQRAEARIHAVRDVLDRARDEFEQPDEADIHRALDGDR